MDAEILKTSGQIAGIGGIAIGAIIIIFREVIRKKIFPNLTKAQAYKLLMSIVVLVSIVAIVGIRAWTYVNVNNTNNQEPAIRLTGVTPYLFKYGFSTVTIVDINVTNRGHALGGITKFKVNVLNSYDFTYDPCPICMRALADGIYNVSFADILNGKNEYLLAHNIEAGSIERVSLVFGGANGEKSYLARISITLFTGDGKMITTEPIDLLLLNFDRGRRISLNDKENKVFRLKLEELINQGIAPVLNRELIIRYFKEGVTENPMRVRYPSLPHWFKEQSGGIRSLLGIVKYFL